MNVNFSDSVCYLFPFNEVNVNDFVRVTYKKEKQAYYQNRMGFVQSVERDQKGGVISLLLTDYTSDPDQYLSDPGTRKLLATRIGEIEVFGQAKPVVVDYDTVEVKVPKSHKALVKIVPLETK